MYCDSIKSSSTSAFDRISANADLLASFMFPSIKASEWTIEQVEKRYRFQKTSFLDCGFHLLNFVNAAVADERISTNSLEFATFKNKVALEHEL
jgi:hypothetical protein